MKRMYWRIGTGLASGLALGGVIWAGSLWAQHAVIIDRAGGRVSPGKAARSRVTVDGPLETRGGRVVVTGDAAGIPVGEPPTAYSVVAGEGTLTAADVSFQAHAVPHASIVETHVELLSNEDRAAQMRAFEADRRAIEFAGQARQATAKRGPDQIAEMRRHLQQLVSDAFQARQEIQQSELKELAERLQRVERQLASRQERRERIIERRVNELLDPELQWEQAGSAGEEGRTVDVRIGAAPDVHTGVVVGSAPNSVFVPAPGVPTIPPAAGADVDLAVTTQPTIVVERVREPDGRVIEERIQGPPAKAARMRVPDESVVDARALTLTREVEGRTTRSTQTMERSPDQLGLTPRHATLLANAIAEAQAVLKTSERVQDQQVARAKLAALDAELNATISMLQADVEGKAANLKYLERELTRLQELFKRGVVPESELQAVQARANIARSYLEQTSALVQLFKRLLKDGDGDKNPLNPNSPLNQGAVLPALPSAPAAAPVPAAAPALPLPPNPPVAAPSVPAAPVVPAAPTKPAVPEAPRGASTNEGSGTAPPASGVETKPAPPIVAASVEPAAPNAAPGSPARP